MTRSIRRSWRPAVLAVALALSAVPAGAALAASGPEPAAVTAELGSDYHVDGAAAAGGDGSQAAPWNSLSTVNATTFAAGDRILLKRGTSCTGTLSPKGSGAAGAPIVVDAYGTGAKPLVAGGGAADAVRLHNQQYWELRNLEVTNEGATAGNRRGIYITLDDYGTGTYYRIANLTVHDVNGDNTKDLGGSSGIHLDVLDGTVKTKFDDVQIDGNEVYTVDRSGINMSTYWKCRASMGWDGCPNHVDNYYPWSRVVVRNNTVHDIGGDGIVMQYTEAGLAEYNVAYDINMRSNLNNAGIWVWNADRVTFQFNEAYRVRRPAGTNDGNAFDADYGTDRTTFQYNYSHDNEGGMILYCGCGGTSSNAVVRYNVSQNDKSRVIMAAGATNGWFYNNTIYLASTSTTKIVEEYSSGTYLTIANNLIVNHGSGGYSIPSGSASHYTFTNNLMYGNHPSSEPDDPYKITEDPKLVSPGSGGTGIGSVAGYQLGADSPALGKGRTIAGNGGRDYWGNPVPTTCAPDIGAHQRGTPDDAGCTPVTPVANGGFETGTLSPWYAWNGASVVAGNARTGSYALRVGPAPASAEQQISVQPNTTYRLSGWAKVATSGETVRIGVKNHGGTETSAPLTSTAYGNGAVSFTTGASSTTATIYCYKSSGRGYGYCDDISVTVESNLAANGGFETGALSPWYAWNGASVVTGNARSGDYALRVGPSPASAEQQVSVQPGTTYRLSGWARVATGGEQVRIGVKNFGGTETSALITSTTYANGTVAFTTGASSTTATIYCYTSTGTGYAYCDDITLT